MPDHWKVTSFYRFVPISEDLLADAQARICRFLEQNRMVGLVVLAREGINGTVAGGEIESFKQFILALVQVPVRFKDSTSEVQPFGKAVVDIRPEIVGLKRPDLVPAQVENRHLSAEEWHEWLTSGREFVLVDTRNEYETRVGKFRGAIDPGMRNFSEWGSYLDETPFPKDVPTLIYCTGGIRCEKAILEMNARGLEQVYQLRDGILGYLEQFPEGEFEGECFVFDDRVALTADLEPTTQFGICPGCGSTTSDTLTCACCGDLARVCLECQGSGFRACGKPCQDRITKKRA